MQKGSSLSGLVVLAESIAAAAAHLRDGLTRTGPLVEALTVASTSAEHLGSRAVSSALDDVRSDADRMRRDLVAAVASAEATLDRALLLAEGGSTPSRSGAQAPPSPPRPSDARVRGRTSPSQQASSIAAHARHRFDEGALDHHVKDVPTAELGQYVDDVLEGRLAVDSKYDADSGRAAHWDPARAAIVIENGETGTVFTPKEGRTYFDDIW